MADAMRSGSLSPQQADERGHFTRVLTGLGWVTTAEHQQFEAAEVGWIDAQLERFLHGTTRVASLSHEYDVATLDIDFPSGMLTLSFALGEITAVVAAIAAFDGVTRVADLHSYREATVGVAVDIALDGDFERFTSESAQRFIDLAG